MGTTTLTAKFNFFVEGSLEFTYKIHSTSSQNKFKLFIDAEEVLSQAALSSLNW